MYHRGRCVCVVELADYPNFTPDGAVALPDCALLRTVNAVWSKARQVSIGRLSIDQ